MTEPYWRRDGTAERYVFDNDAPFGLPFRPTPFTAQLAVGDGDNAYPIEIPVEHRYEGSIFSGEKRTELLVVPAISVRVTPDIADRAGGGPDRRPRGRGRCRPRSARDDDRQRAGRRRRRGRAWTCPSGWRATPASARVHLARADEAATTRFMVYPPMGLAPGAYTVAARVTSGGRTWTRGYDIVEYPHTRRQHIYVPATTTIKALDVQVPPGLSVGYVMGVGDQVPQAIAQLGASLRLLDENDLASADLSKYDAIVTGVRAYERRKDLRAYNQRLIEYARNGGTVLVQYNKFEFNQAQYGPWPAKVSSDRVTDETSPVRVLVPAAPGLYRAQSPRRADLDRLGPGARALLPRRAGPAVHRPGGTDRSVSRQRGPQARRAGRGAIGQGALGLRRPGVVAPAAGRHRRRLSAAGQPDIAWRHRAVTQSAATRAGPARGRESGSAGLA